MPNDMSEAREIADAPIPYARDRGEVDQQISTAHAYPRSVKRFRDDVLAMATINESVAEECTYALPRDGKTIVGPSARFGEIIASAWGNAHCGARVVDDTGEFVTAQGVFWDLQRNVRITYEVRRRITNKQGARFNADMIGVTANAACSIAMRNAILKGIPKAFWSDLWEQSRLVAIGDVTTVANRRAKCVTKFQAYGVSVEQLCAKVGRASIDDVTPDDLGVLLGFAMAIKEGDATPESIFAPTTGAATATGGVSGTKAAMAAAMGGTPTPAAAGVAQADATVTTSTTTTNTATGEITAGSTPAADDDPFADPTPVAGQTAMGV